MRLVTQRRCARGALGCILVKAEIFYRLLKVVNWSQSTCTPLTINNVLGFEKNLEKVSAGKYGFEFFQWILEPASIVGSFLTSLCPDLAQVAPSPAMDYNWWHILQQRRHSEGHAEIGVLTVINTQVGIESMMERNDRWRQTLTTKELIG